MIRGVLCALALMAGASPAAAQNGILFLPRYDFHLAAEHLSHDDQRFVWDTNFGGEVDFVDYGLGRTTFAANYEAVLGEQFRPFDPNQGNYLLDVSTSLRVHGVEVAGLFHHISRHLSDRAKRDAVDWNMFGARVVHEAHPGAALIRTHGEVLGVLVHSNVDYRWEANGGVSARVPVDSHVSVIAAGSARVVGVDGTTGRGTQRGVRGEAGVRFEGQRGAIELIVAAERRIDAYPLENLPISWLSAGFRFVSR